MNIFVVDDNEAFRLYMAKLLTSLNLNTKVFASAEEFISYCRPDSEGILVADLRMPGMSGLDLHRWVGKHDLYLPMILITAYATTPKVVEVMHAGVTSVVSKPPREDDLWEAIHETLAIYRRNVQLHRARRHAIVCLRTLSPQEKQVLEQILQGSTKKAMAKKLQISQFTIERRRSQILKKMQVDSMAALILKATLAKHPLESV